MMRRAARDREACDSNGRGPARGGRGTCYFLPVRHHPRTSLAAHTLYSLAARCRIYVVSTSEERCTTSGRRIAVIVRASRRGLAGARSLGLHALARDRPPYVEVVPVCVQKWRPVVVRARSGRLLWWLGNLGYAQACRSCIAQSLKRSRAVVSRAPVLNGRRSNERHCWLTAVSSASLRASLEWKYGPKRTWYASAGQVSGCQSWLRK